VRRAPPAARDATGPLLEVANSPLTDSLESAGSRRERFARCAMAPAIEPSRSLRGMAATASEADRAVLELWKDGADIKK
jgi:hypothetical protein